MRLDPDFSKQRATCLDWWFATRSLVVLAVSLKLRKVRYLLPLLHAFFRGTGDPSCSWAKSLPFLPQWEKPCRMKSRKQKLNGQKAWCQMLFWGCVRLANERWRAFNSTWWEQLSERGHQRKGIYPYRMPTCYRQEVQGSFVEWDEIYLYSH